MVIWKLVRACLFYFDAEFIHHLSILFIRIGIKLKNFPLRVVSSNFREIPQPAFSERSLIWGMEFPFRVGLAAGFDKNAEILTGLPALGFGFAEIGTVTPRPQPGNARPRLFRDPVRGALFNRMGFNSLGASIVSENVRVARDRLPPFFKLGVNIGKNKDTPLEDAYDDYRAAAQAFEGLADYLVINVSSPNTPGLRSLQTVEALKPIVNSVGNCISQWNKRPPLLLKLAPELKSAELAYLIEVMEKEGVDGWVLTNTLGGALEFQGSTYTGGWSGKPLTELSLQVLREARSVTQKPIISVGGIFSEEDAVTRREAGADLIQIYTGWIFQGPTFPVRLQKRLSRH